MRVAVDTNVLIAGTLFPRWPYEVLQHALRGDFDLILSPVVIREAERNITRRFPAFQQQFSDFLTLVPHEIAPLPTPEEVTANKGLVRQDNDVPIAVSIIAAQVDYFVTTDRDFTDRDETTIQIHAALPGIILPAVFLRTVMNWTSEELERIRNRQWSDLPE